MERTTPLQQSLPTLRRVQRYLSTARQYRWLLAAILALVWGAGLVAAYGEFTSTYESTATVWVLRVSPDLAQMSPDDPNIPIIQTAASQQAELLGQLLQTRSFVEDVISRTSLAPGPGKVTDDKLINDVRKHLRVQTLGNNLLSISFSGRVPRIGPEMVDAALAVRGERVAQARIDATSAVSALYSKDYEVAQSAALDAQRKLDEFNAAHSGTLTDVDAHLQAQLRLVLDFAQVRLADLRGRMDRAVLAPALLEISGQEFQVVDAAREPTSPSGGTRTAATLAAVAFAAGLLLATLLVVVGTLFSAQVLGQADVARLAPVTLFGSVPRAADGTGADGHDLRAKLAAIAFDAAPRSAPD